MEDSLKGATILNHANINLKNLLLSLFKFKIIDSDFYTSCQIKDIESYVRKYNRKDGYRFKNCTYRKL